MVVINKLKTNLESNLMRHNYPNNPNGPAFAGPFDATVAGVFDACNNYLISPHINFLGNLPFRIILH